jgi:hypothetical protein
VALVAAVAVLVVVWLVKGLGAAANVGQLVGVALSVPTLVIGLVVWFGRRNRPDILESDAAAKALARALTRQWEDEAAVRSLNNPDPIPVQWRLIVTSWIMDHPSSVWAEDMVGFDGSSDQIGHLVDQFRRLRRGRLVVLGAAGSGKTTLAVQLIRELLFIRRDEESVPLLVSAASWNARVEPDIWKWLADYLARTYPDVPGVRGLAADRRILPILDGLDEIPSWDRVIMVKALNDFLGPGRLVLTSRPDEYLHAVATARDALTGAAVIEATPLGGSVAADYLALWLPPEPPEAWRRVLDGLRDGTMSTLVEVCSTPLGLWLLRTVLSGRDGDVAHLIELAEHADAEAVRRHLLDQLVPAIIRSRPPTRSPGQDLFRPRRRYNADQTVQWLSLFANRMCSDPVEGQPVRDFGWWDVDRVPVPGWIPRNLGAAVGLAGGLATGFTGGRLGGFYGALLGGSIVGLLCGLVVMARLKDGLDSMSGDFQLPANRVQRALGRWFTVYVLFGSVAGSIIGGGRYAASVVLFVLLVFTVFAETLQCAILYDSILKWVGGRLPGWPFRGGVWLANLVILTSGVIIVVQLHLPAAGGGALFLGLAVGVGCGMNAATEHGVLGIILGPWSGPKYAKSAAAGLRRSLTANVVRIGIGGVVVGSVCVWAGGIGPGLSTGLAAGVAFAVASAVADRRGRRGNPALVYLIVSGWLVARGQLPRRLVAFLDDAHRMGLLRRTGNTYQFRHAELHDYLASRPVPE